MSRPTDILQPQRGGFTLLELLVASLLAVVLGAMTAHLWRHLNAQTADLSDRAAAARELKFALEYLRGDMGAIHWALPVSESRLTISRYTTDGSDDLVEYYLDGMNLFRYDHTTGVSVPAAAHVSGFTVEDAGGSVLRVVITVTCDEVSRQATLLWSTS